MLSVYYNRYFYGNRSLNLIFFISHKTAENIIVFNKSGLTTQEIFQPDFFREFHQQTQTHTYTNIKRIESNRKINQLIRYFIGFWRKKKLQQTVLQTLSHRLSTN
jgi:hypothetical protein